MYWFFPEKNAPVYLFYVLGTFKNQVCHLWWALQYLALWVTNRNIQSVYPDAEWECPSASINKHNTPPPQVSRWSKGNASDFGARSPGFNSGLWQGFLCFCLVLLCFYFWAKTVIGHAIPFTILFHSVSLIYCTIGIKYKSIKIPT